MIKYILFDLDGTLTDPAEGITNSIAYGLERSGIKVEDKDTLKVFIGPPLIPSFMETYGFTESESKQCLAYFREYFEQKGAFENTVYPGITKMLSNLKRDGYTMIVATSKPEKYAVRILEHFGLDVWFDGVYGNNMAETLEKKSDIISYIKETFTEIDPSNTVMVGDRKYDVEGASYHGIRSIGVLYGYGSEEELKNAAYTANNVSDIYDIISRM